MVKKKFKFLEHMSDAYFESYGADLREAFENAALAMFEVITDTSTVKSLIKDEISVQGQDKKALLYNWLEELLFKFDVDGMVYSKFNIKQIKRTPEGYELTAEVWGSKFDPKRHELRTAIKGVTYHLMEIIEEKDKTIARVLLDI